MRVHHVITAATFAISSSFALALPAAAQSQGQNGDVSYEFAFTVSEQDAGTMQNDPATQQRLQQEAAAYCDGIADPSRGITTEYCEAEIVSAVNQQYGE